MLNFANNPHLFSVCRLRQQNLFILQRKVMCFKLIRRCVVFRFFCILLCSFFGAAQNARYCWRYRRPLIHICQNGFQHLDGAVRLFPQDNIRFPAHNNPLIAMCGLLIFIQIAVTGVQKVRNRTQKITTFMMIQRMNILFDCFLFKRTNDVNIDALHIRKHAQIHLRRFICIVQFERVVHSIQRKSHPLEKQRMVNLLVFLVRQQTIPDDNFQRIRLLAVLMIHGIQVSERIAKPLRMLFAFHPSVASFKPAFIQGYARRIILEKFRLRRQLPRIFFFDFLWHFTFKFSCFFLRR